MNLTLSRLPWYGQVGAFAALAAVAVGAFWYVYARPAQTTIEARRTRIVELRAEIDRGLANARRLPEFRRELTGLQAQLERLSTVLPQERDVADLLRRVQAIATQSNLTILGFTPQAVATRELHAEWPIGLQLDGTYHDLGKFLERVSKFPRIINVNSLTIRAKDNPTPASTVTVQCVATTFVLLDPTTARPPEGGRGRGRGRGRGAAATTE